jgi:hypothetical protein
MKVLRYEDSIQLFVRAVARFRNDSGIDHGPFLRDPATVAPSRVAMMRSSAGPEGCASSTFAANHRSCSIEVEDLEEHRAQGLSPGGEAFVYATSPTASSR